jgi:hypothetical protein
LASRIDCVRLAKDMLNELYRPYEAQDTKKLEDMLGELVAREVDFPSFIKQQILCGYLMRLLKDIKDPESEQDLNAFVAAMSPFSSQEMGQGGPEATGDADDGMGPREELTFNHLKPTMGQLDGNLRSKVELVQKILVKDLLNHLFQDGEASTTTTRELLSLMSQQYEGVLVDMDDDVPPGVVAVLDLCRSLLTVLDPTDIDDDSLDMALSLIRAYKKEEDSVSHLVSLALQDNAYYKGLCDDMQLKAGSMKRALPQLRKMAKDLDGAENAIDGLGIIRTMTAALPELRTDLRIGATYKVECRIQEMLEKWGKDTQAKYSETNQFDQEYLAAYSETAKVALERWPQAAALENLNTWAQGLATEQLKNNKVRKLMLAMAACYTANGDDFDSEKFPAFQRVLDECVGITIAKQGEAEKLRNFIMEMADKLFLDLAGGVPILKIIQKAKVVLPAALKPSFEKEIRLAELCMKLHLDIKSFAEGGSTLKDQAEDDTNGEKVRAVLRGQQALEEHVSDHWTSTSWAPGLETLARDCTKLVAQVHQCHDEKHRAQIMMLITECESVARGGNSGEEWHSSVADQGILDDFLETAKSTILAKSGPWYKDKGEKLEGIVKAWKDHDCTFDLSRDGAEQTREKALTLSKRLYLTFIEGLLCSLFSSEKDREMLKKKVHTIKATAGHLYVEWKQVHNVLRTRAEKALKLR